MKKLSLLLLITCLHLLANAQTGSVGIGTNTPNSSAALDIQSSEKGILIPRMSTVQRNAIANAATGLLVFDNTTNSFWFKSSNNWMELVDTLNSPWKKVGNNIYSPGTTNVGIGVVNPTNKLEIDGSMILRNANNVYGYVRRWNPDGLNINAMMGNSLAGTTAGNLVMQIDQSAFTAGNVGIGLDNPIYKLTVNGDIGLYNGTNYTGSFSDLAGDFLINAKAGSSINSTPSQDLIMQYHTGLGIISGRVGIGTNTPAEKLDVNGNLRVSGELNRPGTGLANLVPIAYGRINADGSIASGTGNFTSLHTITGQYTIQVTGENFTASNAYGIGTVERAGNTGIYSIQAEPGAFAVFRFYILHNKVNYGYDDNSGITYISSLVPEQLDAPFYFAIYKL